MNKLLVALDGSPQQLGVLSAAVTLARRTGARLVLFHSVGLAEPLPPEAMKSDPAALPDMLGS